MRVEQGEQTNLNFSFFFRGLAIGFAIAAPVGPIGVLCIRRTLSDGRLAGLACGLGAATADAGYGAVAGFGLTAVSNLLVRQQTALQIVGGLFLCYLGIKTFLSGPAGQPAATRNAGLTGAYISTLFLTLTNPMTILSFAAVFAGLGLGSGTDDHVAATFLVSGVFTGSAIWWLLLSGVVGMCRGKLDLQWLPWLNRLSGIVLVVFGLIALYSLRGRF